MIKTDPQKANPAATNDPPIHTETAGSAAQTPRQKLADEAEAFCADLERFFRRAYGEVPKATELGEIRAQQATVRDLINRASGMGGGESPEQTGALEAERDKFKD